MLLIDTAGIRESFKSKLTVAFAYTAIVGSTERQVVVEEMNGIIVNAGSTCTGIVNDVLDVLRTAAVDVEGQRFFFGIDHLKRL